MTDELSIQQRRPSALPYAIGGAAVGGLGGYYGLPKVASDLVTTPGKYESFEALVKEASDNDKFVKAIAEAKDHEKPLMEKMKGVGDKIKNAEAEWQKGLDKALKEKNLDTAIYETVTEVTGEGVKKTTTIQKALEHSARKFDKAADALRDATTPEAKEAAKKTLKELEDNFGKLTEQILEQCEFKGSESEIKVAKEALTKELKNYREALTSHFNIERTPAVAEDLVKDFTKAQKDKKTAQGLLDDAFKALEEALGKKDLAKLHQNNSANFENIVSRNITAENKRLDTLKTLQEKFIAAGPNKERWTMIMGETFGFERTDVKAIDKFLEGLTDKQKEAFKKLFKETEPTKEAFENLIKESQGRLDNINKAKNTVKTESEKIFGFVKEVTDPVTKEVKKEKIDGIVDTMKKLQEQAKAKYEGAAIRDGKLIKPDGKVWKAPKTPTAKPTLDWGGLTGITVKKDAAIEYISGGKTTTKQVLKEGLSDEAKKVVEEYTKANGSKEDAAKKVTEGLKDDVKGLFERVKDNKKLLWGTAAVAAVGALLALALRPKAKEQA